MINAPSKTITPLPLDLISSWYLEGILMVKVKKTITEMAKALKIEYSDFIQSIKESLLETEIMDKLIESANKIILELGLKTNDVIMLIDDTVSDHPYAQEIEGIGKVYDSCQNKPVKGFRVLNIMIVIGNTTFIVYSEIFLTKAQSGHSYKHKSDIIDNVICKLRKFFNITKVVADSHYVNRAIVDFLIEYKIDFLLRSKTNLVVVHEGEKKKVKELCHLDKNEKFKCKEAFWGKHKIFVCSEKLPNGIVRFFFALFDWTKILCKSFIKYDGVLKSIIEPQNNILDLITAA